MDEIKLDVQIRDFKGRRKVKKLRNDNIVPAIVYGGERKPTSIKVNRLEYESIMRHHKGQNVVFHLNVLDGDKKLRDYSAIVKEEQLEPVHDSLLHLDFQRISLTQEIEVKVALEVKGEAAGVKQGGGSIDQTMWEIDVICLPTNIPEKLEVFVEELEIGDSIHVKDIKLPAGVTTKHDLEAMVLSVVPPMKEEEEVPAEGEELTEPEVIGEKKEGEAKAEGEADAKTEEKAEEKKDDKDKGEGKS